MLLISLGQLDIEDEWTKYSLLELVKDATTESIISNINKFSVLHYVYNNDVNRLMFNVSDANSEKQYIAVTGALTTMKRKDFEAYISKFNYELTSNLKKCKYLVTNTPNSGSSKNKDAQKYGVEIITENDFLELLSK